MIIKALNKSIPRAEKAVGQVSYELTEKQIKGRAFSRSLYVVQDIKAGEVITEENVRSIRPGYRMHPKELGKWMGKPSPKDYTKGDRFLINKETE